MSIILKQFAFGSIIQLKTGSTNNSTDEKIFEDSQTNIDGTNFLSQMLVQNRY